MFKTDVDHNICILVKCTCTALQKAREQRQRRSESYRVEVWIQPSKGMESERLWTNENSESAVAASESASAKRSISSYGGFSEAGAGGEGATGESAEAEDEEDVDSESDEALADMDLPDLKRRFVLYYLSSHSKLFTKIGYERCAA